MKKKYIEIEIGNFVQFVEYIDEHCGKEELLCRGQRKDWPLLPKLARLFPSSTNNVIEVEKYIYSELERKVRPFIPDVVFKSDLDVLMIGQHYGLPTRLLDWTGNPLAALWFALRHANSDENGNAIVWLFSPADKEDAVRRGWDDHPFELSKTMYVRPTHLDKRLIAQKAYFTLHGYDENKEGFMPLEDDESLEGALTKISLDAKAVYSARLSLERCGINSATLFPDLTGLCENIEALAKMKYG